MNQRTWLTVALALAALGLFVAMWLLPSAQPGIPLRSRTVDTAPTASFDGEVLGVAVPSGSEEARETLAPAGAAVQTAPEGANLRISGIVVTQDQVPVASATCELLRGEEPAGLGGLVPRPRAEPVLLSRMSTDASGGFSFDAPAGFWTLRVTADGAAPFEESGLRSGDFRWVELTPSAAVTVRVTDESGTPVANAGVRVVRGRFSDPGQARVTVRTGADGRAMLDGLPAGTWFVRVSHSDYLTQIAALPGSRRAALSLDVVLGEGLILEGRVTSTDAAGAEGTFVPSGATVRFDTDDGLVTSHSVLCDAQGRYRSKWPFPRGRAIEVSARAAGYGEIRRELALEAPASDSTLRQDFALHTEERTAIGRVVSRDGTPIPGVDVFAQPLESLPPLTTIQIPSAEELTVAGVPDLTAFAPKASYRTLRWLAATTDEQGYFRAGSLHPARPYGLLILAEGRSNATLWLEESAPGSTHDFGSVVLDRPGRVAGHVRRADGSAMEGAHVYAVESPTYSLVAGTEFTTTRPEALAAGLEATTSASGYFAIEPFPRRPFRLMCKGIMHGPYTFDENGNLAELELVAEDLHRRAAERAIPLAIQVVDAQGGPVPRAYVEVQRLDDKQSDSDPLNGWQWARGGASGEVRLSVSSRGRYAVTAKDMEGLLDTSTAQVEVGGQGTMTVTVELPLNSTPPGMLEGCVLSHSGEPLENMRVTLIPVAGATSCSCMKFDATTDALGQFSFGSFMDGQHRIIVSDPTGHLAPGQLYPARPGPPVTVRM